MITSYDVRDIRTQVEFDEKFATKILSQPAIKLMAVRGIRHQNPWFELLLGVQKSAPSVRFLLDLRWYFN
jgi:hypothetical protein